MAGSETGHGENFVISPIPNPSKRQNPSRAAVREDCHQTSFLMSGNGGAYTPVDQGIQGGEITI
jgi:hypothetical protein